MVNKTEGAWFNRRWKRKLESKTGKRDWEKILTKGTSK
jgi:hypothetical protein